MVTVTHDRAYFGVHLGDTIIDITMETRGPEHIVELMEALTKAGYEFERVCRAAAGANRIPRHDRSSSKGWTRRHNPSVDVRPWRRAY